MRLNFSLGIALLTLLGACTETAACNAGPDRAPCTATALQYSGPAATPSANRTVSVHIDRAFSVYDRTKILRAVNEWNVVLNGQIRIDVAGDFDGTNVPAGGQDKWVITKIDGSNPLMASPVMRRALALTVGTNNAVIYVATDRVGSRDLGGIMMHEFGHALGAGHDSGSALMHPYYAGDKQRCIDKGAARAVATAQKLAFETLNFCA